MEEIPVCAECGVPFQFSERHVWLPGGFTAQATDREHRMVFVECDNLDPLFNVIGELIGVPIEHIVIETKRRATRDYLDKLLPLEVRMRIRAGEVSVEPLIEVVNNLGHVLGYGHSELLGVKLEMKEDDFSVERLTEPYSILLWAGDYAGSAEAIDGRVQEVCYEETSPGVFEMRTRPSEAPPGLEERLSPRTYRYAAAGGMELEKCPGCAAPAALAEYTWDVGRGVIQSPVGRRVALFGPSHLESIFEELERELGEEIPRVVVEAQRRFTLSGIYSPDEIGGEEEFRELVALRGLGDLERLEVSGRGLRMKIRNAALHLMMTGLIQGYYEGATGSRSAVEWELGEDDTLEVRVTPDRTAVPV